ncbi:helix-turn-helix transcriptional regulator [Streptomyces sp. NA02950]|uniref:helix-turn-helix transcriptional regulator n=1 Tax=Streptomyces sp. NA02950 TaxID=2742137 RepID=UPI001591FD1D|nr:helix-turn-helix transcriptional regulator [Streptomyces sp. NA02950]QKV92625.1 helix-turn-helix transcriptional regulator [Streptomyces sp. NA02950]
MSGYRERGSRLGGGAVVWTRDAGHGPQRVLPDGCIDLIWTDAGDAAPDGELFVAGPDTRAQLAAAPPGTRYVGLRFAPGTGPAVLGVPAHELRNLRVPLAALWPAAQVRRLTASLAGRAAADDTGAGSAAPAVGRALEETALGRLREAPPPDPAMAAVVAGLARGRGVAEVARAAGLGERLLHRRSLAAFGYGPKTLGRVLRLNRALDLARGGVPFAEVAVAAGYADQAHLAREVRAMAGVPLGRLLTESG